MRGRSSGLTLVEAALVLAVVGAVAAVFVPAFARHLRVSKTEEAAEELAALERRAEAYFATPHRLADGKLEVGCLPEAAGPAPEKPSQKPVEVKFSDPSTPGHATWKALGFQPDDMIRYRYSFVPVKSGCGLTAPHGEPILTLRAEGDLDGDGKLSTFERQATVSKDGRLVPVGILFERDRME